LHVRSVLGLLGSFDANRDVSNRPQGLGRWNSERDSKVFEIAYWSFLDLSIFPFPFDAYEGVSKIPGLAAWSENCKWYSSLTLDAVVSLFSESV
jgi:hypothetical protein